MKYKTINYLYGTEMDKGIAKMISEGWAVVHTFNYEENYYITFAK